MDWSDPAEWLRAQLAQQSWLEPLEPSIAQTPDWALLVVGPALLATFSLVLSWTWPRTRPVSECEVRSGEERSASAFDNSDLESGRAMNTTGVPVGRNEDRAVRVFVSSTFVDMRAERNQLATTTFPALRQRFRDRGVELFEVDLRWGVAESDVTLDVCLSEVNRCKPYFIGLLGQRYGTVLTNDDAPSALKETFPVVRDGVGRSLTEIEILQAVLTDPEGAKRALFFERDAAWLNTLSDEDRSHFEERSEEARFRLNSLKERIRSVAKVQIYNSPDDLGPAIEAALGEVLEASFPEETATDDFALNDRLHAAYARDRLGPHVAAKSNIERLNQWMLEQGAPPLLVAGSSGGGKSKLIAEWLQAWHTSHPRDVLFAHYLGASPDSADPVLIMLRLWEHLNRSTGETIDLPQGDAEFADIAAGLVSRLAQAASIAERQGFSIVIALDGLDKLVSEQSLRWLPSVLAPQIRLLTSALDGEAKSAALERNWKVVEVEPLDDAARNQLIAETLRLWGKSDLAPARKQQIVSHHLSGLPLFLKTTLEELRVSAAEDVLDARLRVYLEAGDMPDLFGRVLDRLEHECGRDFVRQALSLVWAGRWGLEEAEIINISGVPPLAWAKLRNALGDNLRDQAGRMTFGHEFLKHAVESRFLSSDEEKKSIHLAIADAFAARSPDFRQAEELPYQLRKAEAWERLQVLLTDLDRLPLLRNQGDATLAAHWFPLQKRGVSPAKLLVDGVESRRPHSEWSMSDFDLAFSVDELLEFLGGRSENEERLSRLSLAAAEAHTPLDLRLLVEALERLSGTLESRGKYLESQNVQRDAYARRRKLNGDSAKETLRALRYLGRRMYLCGEWETARHTLEGALRQHQDAYGVANAESLDCENELGRVFLAEKRLDAAIGAFTRVVDGRSRVLGPVHPATLGAKLNLALAMQRAGDYVAAIRLEESVVAIATESFGRSHPLTLVALNNLGDAKRLAGDLHGAVEIQEAVVARQVEVSGQAHPQTLTSTLQLAATLRQLRNYERAHTLVQAALPLSREALGAHHPTTLETKSTLATLTFLLGQHAEAVRIGREVLTEKEVTFGKDHHQSIWTMYYLALGLERLERRSEAQELLYRALGVCFNQDGAHAESTFTCERSLEQSLLRTGDCGAAEYFVREQIRVLRRRGQSEQLAKATERLAAIRAANAAVSINTRMEKTMVTLVHANGAALDEHEFVAAWVLLCAEGLPGVAPLSASMELRPRAQSLAQQIEAGFGLSVDVLCRRLAPNQYINTMQATREFRDANPGLLDVVEDEEPYRAYLSQGVRQRWLALSGAERSHWLQRAMRIWAAI